MKAKLCSQDEKCNIDLKKTLLSHYITENVGKKKEWKISSLLRVKVTG